MANGGCIKIELDDSKYSSPMPVIGLYIAAASLVCSLAILYDIVSGFRRRKQWLPCQWFSLNSVTLTLLSIAAKIPVDLTTSMPGALDQFSKISGTVLICISMGFLMPSLGINQSSECMNNMVALSIFVVTVIVNICIQISTGVIVMFISDHIVVMCCMVALLLALWVSAVDIKNQKGMSIDRNKDLLTKGKGSLMQRLKLAYLYGYNHNPQFLLCRQPNCHLVGTLCIVCFAVTIRVVFSFLSLEFCGGYSDYTWSMWIIVVTQILTIVVGSFATSFRSLFTLVKNLKFNPIGKALQDETRNVINSNILLISNYFGEVLHLLMMLQIGFVIIFVILPLCVVLLVFRRLIGSTLGFMRTVEDNADIQEYKHLIQKDDRTGSPVHVPSANGGSNTVSPPPAERPTQKDDNGFDKWSLGKSVKDMKSWIEVSKSKPLIHLSELLSNTLPSRPLHTMELKDETHPELQVIHVSSLSMILLVRIAQVLIPSRLSASLVQAYDEVYETVQYIDDKIVSASGENRSKSRLAKAVRGGDDFSSIMIFDIPEPDNTGTTQIQPDLFRARVIIEVLKNTLPLDIVWEEVAVIGRFLSCRVYSSVEDIHNYIQQLFVDMLHMYLAQIPSAIFKEVTESPAEEFGQRIRVSMKLLCRIEPMEDHVQWSFPVQCDITKLITAQDPTAQTTQDASSQTSQVPTTLTTQGSTSQTTQDTSTQITQASTSQTIQDPTAQTTQDSSSQTSQDPTTLTTQGSTSQTIQDPTTQTTQDASSQTSQDPATLTTQGSTSQATQDPTTQTTQDASSQTSQDPTTLTTQGSTSQTIQDPTTQTTQDASSQTSQDPATLTTQGSTSQATQDPTTQTTQDASSQTSQDPTTLTTQGSTSQTIQDPTTQTTQDASSQTSQDPATLTTQGSTSQATQDPTTQTTQDASSQTSQDPTTLTTQGSTSQTIQDPTTQTTQDASSQTSQDPATLTTQGSTSQATQDPTTQTTQDASSQTSQDPTTLTTQGSTSHNTQDSSTQITQASTSQTIQDPTTQTIHDASSQTSQDPTTLTTQGSTSQTIQDPTTQTTQDASSQTSQDPATLTTQGSTSQATQDPTTQTTQDASSQTSQDPTTLTTQGSTSHTTQDSSTQITQASTSQTIQDPTTQTIHDASSQTSQDPTTLTTQGSISHTTQDPNTQITQASTYQTIQDPTTQTTQDASSQTSQDPTTLTTQGSTSQATQDPSTHITQAQTIQDPTTQTTQDASSQTSQDPTTLTTQGSTSHTTQDSSTQITQASTSQTIQDPTTQTTQDASSQTSQDPSTLTTQGSISHTTQDPNTQITQASTNQTIQDPTTQTTQDVSSQTSQDPTTLTTQGSTSQTTQNPSTHITQASTSQIIQDRTAQTTGSVIITIEGENVDASEDALVKVDDVNNVPSISDCVIIQIVG